MATCSIEDCTSPTKARTWCSMHYARYRRTGDPIATTNSPHAAEKLCMVCGARDWPGIRRRTCSERCSQLFYTNGAVPPPTHAACVICNTVIDLFVLGKAGRKRRADVKLCRSCKLAKYKRHQMSATQLAARDGLACGICGVLVDLTLRMPDPGTPSVDHIVPVARGGSHGPENLQLSHLGCNRTKGDRYIGLMRVGGA